MTSKPDETSTPAEPTLDPDAKPPRKLKLAPCPICGRNVLDGESCRHCGHPVK